MRFARYALRPGLVVALAVVGLAASPGDARAHARLLRSAPSDGQVLDRSPAAIEFWFNEILDEEFNAVEVFPAGGTRGEKKHNLVSGSPTVDAADGTHLEVDLPALPPGAYVVHWKVLSRDGHTALGRTSFEIRGED